MEKTVTTCDVCGVERKQANHWFRYAKCGTTLYIGRYGDPPFVVELSKSGVTTIASEFHACGERCLMKAAVGILAEISQPQPSDQPPIP